MSFNMLTINRFGNMLQVSIPAGIMIELLGSLICFLSGLLMEDIPSLANRPRLSLGLDSVLSVSLVSY